MTLASELLPELLEAPGSQLDPALRKKLLAWSVPPRALEILEVLDLCVHGGLGSGFVVSLLDMMLQDAIRVEGTTYEAVVALATWRGPPEPKKPGGLPGERPPEYSDTSCGLITGSSRGVKVI